MPSVDDQINGAKAAASRDRDAAAALSALKLIQLKRKSPKAAAGHWQDADLTPEDKQNLFAWLTRLLPSKAKKPALPPFSFAQIGRVLRRYPSLAIVCLTLFAVLISATLNTPRVFLGTLLSNVEVTWQLNGIGVARVTLPLSSNIAVTSATTDGYFVVRGWLERSGHVSALVPKTAVQFDH